jgi:hypothetical protein
LPPSWEGMRTTTATRFYRAPTRTVHVGSRACRCREGQVVGTECHGDWFTHARMEILIRAERPAIRL